MDQQTNSRAEADQAVEIDLLDLLGYYLSHLPLLIAMIAAGALIAGFFTIRFIPKRYTATSRMYMISASSDSVVNLSDLNIGASLSNDYVELMMSRPVIEEVNEKLGLGYSYEQLAGMISLGVVSNTRIVKISATSTDPQEAMDIADTIDWRRVKSIRTLNMVADIFEVNKEYEKCRDILKLVGVRVLFKFVCFVAETDSSHGRYLVSK